MSLSRSLASKFAKITKSEKQTNKETTVYGTIKEHDGSKYVLLDGAEILTPVITTVDFEDGERVTVLLKNHTATVTGNITSPASRYSSVQNLEQKVKDNATLITNMKVYQGTTNPTNPVKGETLWIDTSSQPPLLKQYTLDGKWEVVGTSSLKTSYILILNDRIDINSGGSVNIRAGANFTVDADNLDIDENGLIRATKAELVEATINGNVFVNGYPVWHAGSIVVSSSAPANPKKGMVWINPSNDIIQTTYTTSFLVDTSDGQYYLPFDSTEYLCPEVQLTGTSPDSLIGGVSYTYTYTVRIPIYSNNHHGPHYIMASIDYSDNGDPMTLRFPVQEINAKGLTFYEQSVTTSNPWLGDQRFITLSVAVVNGSEGVIVSSNNDIFGDSNYDITLDMIATPNTSAGWQIATVKYFAG